MTIKIRYWMMYLAGSFVHLTLGMIFAGMELTKNQEAIFSSWWILMFILLGIAAMFNNERLNDVALIFKVGKLGNE